MHHKQLPIHFYHVIVATLGQISPETATLFQLVICGFVSFYRILPICRNSTQSNPNGRRRKQRSVTFHACQYRPRHWQHFYRSTWPIRLRLQNDGCVYCSIWLRTTTFFCIRPSLPTTTLCQRVICWLSDGLGYKFDRTRGHPGEGPHENENVCVWCGCVRVYAWICSLHACSCRSLSSLRFCANFVHESSARESQCM
jgi:hypothetical protein